MTLDPDTVILITAIVVHVAGDRWLRALMPPMVTGTIVALIGLNLAPAAKNNFVVSPVTATVTLVVILVLSVLSKGMISRLAILGGVIAGYAAAASGVERSGLTSWPADLDPLPETFSRQVGPRVVQGFPALVDTGATSVAFNENQARRLGIDYRVDGKQIVVGTASGTAKAWRVHLNSVKVGAIDVMGVEAVVVEGSSPTEALLGMSFLGRVSWREDQGVLRLESKI